MSNKIYENIVQLNLIFISLNKHTQVVTNCNRLISQSKMKY